MFWYYSRKERADGTFKGRRNRIQQTREGTEGATSSVHSETILFAVSLCKGSNFGDLFVCTPDFLLDDRHHCLRLLCLVNWLSNWHRIRLRSRLLLHVRLGVPRFSPSLDPCILFIDAHGIRVPNRRLLCRSLGLLLLCLDTFLSTLNASLLLPCLPLCHVGRVGLLISLVDRLLDSISKFCTALGLFERDALI